MATENLVVPEEYLVEFIEIIRTGLKKLEVCQDLEDYLVEWCEDTEEYLSRI